MINRTDPELDTSTSQAQADLTSTQRLQLLHAGTAARLASLNQHTAATLHSMSRSVLPSSTVHITRCSEELQCDHKQRYDFFTLHRLQSYTADQLGRMQASGSMHNASHGVEGMCHCSAGKCSSAEVVPHHVDNIKLPCTNISKIASDSQPHSSTSCSSVSSTSQSSQILKQKTSSDAAAAAAARCERGGSGHLSGHLSILRHKASVDGATLRRHAAIVLADMREDTATAAQGEMAGLLRSFTL